MPAVTHLLLLKALWRAPLISPGKFLSTFLLSHFQGVNITLALHGIYVKSHVPWWLPISQLRVAN